MVIHSSEALDESILGGIKLYDYVLVVLKHSLGIKCVFYMQVGSSDEQMVGLFR